jgi:integrase/recombinase XerD
MAPIRGLMPGSDAIGTIVRYALQRAQVDAPHRGSHQRGASFNEIGEVLPIKDHRPPRSTLGWISVHCVSWALPWPGGVR